MKNTIISIFLAALLLSGCNDWLDVSPKNQVRADQVFEDPAAYKDALIGVYIKMRSSSLYGGDLVWGNIERLSQHWDEVQDSDWRIYNYVSVSLRSTFFNWYQGLYAVIADANVILEEIDSQKEIFSPGEYELIKGELLGIRAYCHFDLLRLFGPVPTNIKPGSMLPYVETVSTSPHPFHTYSEYILKLENDLKTAGTLLKAWDPIVSDTLKNLYITGLDRFWEKRQVQMNYYALTALAARFYLWTDNQAEAHKLAMEVIESKKYSLGDASGMNNTNYNYSLTSEHIFAMSYTDLYRTARNNFTSDGEYSKGRTQLAELFDLGTGTFDIRFTNLWQEYVLSNNSRKFTIKKYWQKEGESYGQIPLIRLSELYLIAIETSTQEQIDELFTAFYPKRGLQPPGTLSREALKERIIKEYHREFYAEGQGFYAYKRLNVEDILWSSYKGGEAIYVLPLPDNEIKN